MNIYPDLINLYITDSGKLKTPKSRVTYRTEIRALQLMFPFKAISALTTDDLTAFCLAKKVNGGPRSPASINLRKSILTTFFRWCDYKELLGKKNPALGLPYRVEVPNKPTRVNTWLTTEQTRDLLRALPTDTVKARRDRVLTYTGLFTGLRIDGLVGLRWSSFTDDFSKVHLIAKGDKPLEISLPDELQSVLREWHTEISPNQSPDGPVFFSISFQMDSTGTSYVWAPRWETPLGQAGARTVVANSGKLVETMTGSRLRPHDMRRTNANLLEEAGFDVKSISLVLGHSNIATTDRYLNKNPNKVLQANKGFKLGI